MMTLRNWWNNIRYRRDLLFWVIAGVLLAAYLFTVLRFDVARLAGTLVALLLAITVHECAHAWVADRLGDPTARYLGRVSLNPLVHLDPLGSVMMLMTAITGIGIGWGKPVPVAPHRLKYGSRLGNGIVAFSGPLSNVALATLFGLILRALVALPLRGNLVMFQAIVFLDIIIWTNLGLAMFNLLPLPPLDGHSVLLGLLSLSRAHWAWRASQFIIALQQQGPMLLFGLLIITQMLGLNLIGRLIGPPVVFLHRLIVG